MSNYCSKQELSDELKVFIETGAVSDKLYFIIQTMCAGLAKRYGIGLDADEFTQECWLLLLRKKDRISTEPGQNSFSYLTTCFYNILMRTHTLKKADILFLDDFTMSCLNFIPSSELRRKGNSKKIK